MPPWTQGPIILGYPAISFRGFYLLPGWYISVVEIHDDLQRAGWFCDTLISFSTLKSGTVTYDLLWYENLGFVFVQCFLRDRPHDKSPWKYHLEFLFLYLSIWFKQIEETTSKWPDDLVNLLRCQQNAGGCICQRPVPSTRGWCWSRCPIPNDKSMGSKH